MALFTIAGDDALAHRPEFWILVRFPAVERLAVEHTNPAVALLCMSDVWRDQKRNESAELRNNSHSFRCYRSRLFRVRFDRQDFSYSNYASSWLTTKSDSLTLVRHGCTL